MAQLLIVDDEPTLLSLLRRYLERQGHQLETCGSAEEALPIFAKDPAGFDLVITDLTLPGASGAELIAQLRALNPTVPALIASGFPYEPQLPGVEFLQKPFLPQMLAEHIARLVKP